MFSKLKVPLFGGSAYSTSHYPGPNATTGMHFTSGARLGLGAPSLSFTEAFLEHQRRNLHENSD